DYADLIAINKFEKRGALDALRDVRKQVRRNRTAFHVEDAALPVYGTVASRFADPGVTALYLDLLAKIGEKTGQELRSRLDAPEGKHGPPADSVVPPQRQRYLAEIAETVRGYHRRGADQVSAARRRQRLAATAAEIPEVAPQL